MSLKKKPAAPPAAPPVPAYASPLLPIQLLEADADVFRRKQADYAPDGPAPKSFTLRMDALENFRFSAWFASRVCRGLPEDDPRRAAAVLLGVKASRLMTVGLEGTASNEAIDDTESDFRNYSAILDALNREARAKG